MALERELELFERHLEEWIQEHGGKYVLIRDDETAEFFPSFEDAYVAGLKRWGMVEFLVRRIEKVPALNYILLSA